MSNRLSQSDNFFLNQLIITCEINDLTEKESLGYVKRKFGRSISRRTFYLHKRELYEKKILKKTESFLPHLGKSQRLFPEKKYLNFQNEESLKYNNAAKLDFIPEHFYNFIYHANDSIINAHKFFARLNKLRETSKRNYESVPPNATIRKEYVNCGKYPCRRRKHGPYYFAYWRDESKKLIKKYLGKYNPRDKESLKLIDLSPIRTSVRA